MRRVTRRFLFSVIGCLGLMVVLWTTGHADETANPDRVKRGEYLVRTMGCGDCHTPWKMGSMGPEPDSTKLLSGHPQEVIMPAAPAVPMPWGGSYSATFTGWAGPWGVSFSRNLTPDKETGLGDWTEENFVQTMRTGRQMGKGRMLLPPMPIPSYMNMTDDDLKSIYAYLRTIPVVSNRVPDPVAPPAPPGGGK